MNEIQSIKAQIRNKQSLAVIFITAAIICFALGIISTATGHVLTGIIALLVASVLIGLTISNESDMQWWQMRLAQEQRFARRSNRKAL